MNFATSPSNAIASLIAVLIMAAVHICTGQAEGAFGPRPRPMSLARRRGNQGCDSPFKRKNRGLTGRPAALRRHLLQPERAGHPGRHLGSRPQPTIGWRRHRPPPQPREQRRLQGRRRPPVMPALVAQRPRGHLDQSVMLPALIAGSATASSERSRLYRGVKGP